MKKLLLVIVLLAAAGFARGSHEIAISADQMDNLGISLGTVERASALSTDQLPARVVIPPQQERVVSAPQGGLVTGLHTAVGEEVDENQAMARIDSPELISVQREFLQAVTQHRLAKSRLDRDRQLFEEGIIAERRYLQTKSEYEEAVATLDERRQALRLTGMSAAAVDELEKTRQLSSTLSVTAPMAGVVLEQMAVVGQRVERAEALYRIGRLEPLWLEIRVPVDRLEGIETGDQVQVPPCPPAEAKVTVISQDVDRENQTVLVRASVTGVEGCLRAGQFLQVRLRLSAEEAQYRVSRSAVVRSGKESFVFVHAPNGFVPIPVEVAGDDGEHSIISGPLSAGQKVAVSGLAAIKAAWLGMGGGD